MINHVSNPYLSLGFADTYENAKLFFTELLSKRYTVVRDDRNPDYLIHGDSNFGQTHFNYRNYKKKIFYTGEPVSPSYTLYDHAITFDHENSPKHYRLPLYVLEFWAMQKDDGINFFAIDKEKKKNLENVENQDFILQHKTHLAAYIQSNPNCTFRNIFVESLLKTKHPIICGGPHLNNTGYVVPRNRLKKIQFFTTAYFGLALENGSKPGYVTEKLIDAYAANTVPVYWGSKTINRDFNPKSFITVPENYSHDEIIKYMEHLTTLSGRKEYLDILTAPIFTDNIPNSCVNTELFLDWFNTFVYEG